MENANDIGSAMREMRSTVLVCGDPACLPRSFGFMG
jgi:hypothetical protein